MSLLDSATNAVKTVTNFVSSGPATGLTDTSSATGFLGKLVKAFTGPKVALPLKNVLHDYASYTYVLGLSCLSPAEYNSASYMKGSRTTLICKTGGIDPNNRVATPYGKLDFFIDNLTLQSQIGFQDNQASNVTDLEFDIIEPYSMGLLVIALQIAAKNKGYNNWRDATYLLSIEFRGNKLTGKMEKIPGTTRYIPIIITDWQMTADASGARYHVTAMPTNMSAFSDVNHKIKSDVKITGASVVELLQTGEDSLQAVLNKRAKYQADQIKAVPDQYIITFPIDSSTNASQVGASENKTPAAINISSLQDLTSKLGLKFQSDPGKGSGATQDFSQVNELGKSIINFDVYRSGDKPVSSPGDVYDNTTGQFNKNKIVTDTNKTDFKFAQDTSISNAINQVLLKSKFIEDTFEPSRLSPEGYRGWWRIDTQTYIIDTNANDGITNKKPMVYVYRVVPYNAHSSKLIGANLKAPGFDVMKQQVVKKYEYTYTGHNVDITNFKFKLDNSYGMFLSGDILDRSQDSLTRNAQSQKVEKDKTTNNVQPLPSGDPSNVPLGSFPAIVKWAKTITGTDKKGGGGLDSDSVRAARLWHDAVTDSTQGMQDLELDILGDPWYIVQSGMGNYTSGPGQVPNIKADGTINYQDGEVDVLVEFKTPIDIDLQKGLYSFKSVKSTAPLIGFSGLYQLTEVESRFSNGMFTQRLYGMRRQFQESKKEATPDQTFSTNRKEQGKQEWYE